MLSRLARLTARQGAALVVAMLAITGVALGSYSYVTQYGTSGNDTFTETGSTSYHAYGFKGSDTFRDTGSGSDLLVGDGNCTNQLPNDDSYCATDPQAGDGSGDALSAGAGYDALIGGGGATNVLAGGTNVDYIQGGPHHNTITSSTAGDVIYTPDVGSTSTITLKSTPNGSVVDTQNGSTASNYDTITCQSGPNGNDYLYIDRADQTRNCNPSHISYKAPGSGPSRDSRVGSLVGHVQTTPRSVKTTKVAHRKANKHRKAHAR